MSVEMMDWILSCDSFSLNRTLEKSKLITIGRDDKHTENDIKFPPEHVYCSASHGTFWINYAYQLIYQDKVKNF